MCNRQQSVQRLVIGLSSILVLDDLINMVLVPLMPQFVRTHNWSAWQAGVVLGGSTVGLILLSPVIGHWLGRGAPMRLIYVLSGIGSICAAIALGYARGFLSLAVATGILGVAEAIVSPTLFGSLGQVLTDDRREQTLLAVNRWAILGSLFTPLFSAGLLVFWDRRTVFLSIAICLGVFILGLTPVIPWRLSRSHLPGSALRPGASILMLGTLVMLVIGLFSLLLPLRLAIPLHWTAAQTGLYYFSVGLVVAGAQWGAASVSILRSPLVRIVGSLTWLTAGLVGLSWIRAPWGFAITAWGVAPPIGVVLDMVFGHAGESEDAAASFGWLEAALAAGGLLGTVGGGFLISWGGLSLPLWVTAAVMASAVIWIGVRRPTPFREGDALGDGPDRMPGG